MTITKRILAGACIAGATALTVPALANHSWGSYHWERTGDEVTIPVNDHTTGAWPGRVAIAVADWNQSIRVQSPLDSDRSGDSACNLTLNEIHVCNDDYGNNGWLGIASISATRGRTTHIIAGSTKLNDYYFNLPQYSGESWAQLVACQEIGHDYGLGHQNENFDTDLTTSCMEYTRLPAGNEHPDFHDYAMLEEIYAHSDSSGDTSGPGPGRGGGPKKNLGAVGNGPAEWGQAIGFDASGRPNLYVRSMASYDIITHVTWAIGEGPESPFGKSVDFHAH